MKKLSLLIACSAAVLASCGGASSTLEQTETESEVAADVEADPKVVINTLQSLVDALSGCLEGDDAACEAKDEALSSPSGEFSDAFSAAQPWWEESCLEGIAEACRRVAETNDTEQLSADLQDAVTNCADATAMFCTVNAEDGATEVDDRTEIVEGIIAGCEAGDPTACDVIRVAFPIGSDEEVAARECGYKEPAELFERCITVEEEEASQGEVWDEIPREVGDNAELDALYNECATGEAASCDMLRGSSVPGSEYRALADVCGPAGTFDGVACDQTIPRRVGDDPALDANVEACFSGSMEDCDRLRFGTFNNTEYLYLSLTCGETRSPDSFEAYIGKPCMELDWETTPWSAAELEAALPGYEEELAAGWVLTRVD